MKFMDPVEIINTCKTGVNKIHVPGNYCRKGTQNSCLKGRESLGQTRKERNQIILDHHLLCWQTGSGLDQTEASPNLLKKVTV